ncbi:uncharacterized protein LACBIDRAFT_318163 [Laccaria bicolor S238N-H82]|uniref:Predicted protein n=2 Tax=Laccaria bicolor TaxID=29883 RepID=B0D650_LACBS|nr:uncharacterized protein LACBIDRAFT_318163 [Laccaria bicolor S238N-H82]EDR09880.1 predicted protein [Laccaria bicolor S238N-H82]|eukprot:XP_001879265.1 predicted protein [Laccaria bicolor S238N-H82]
MSNEYNPPLGIAFRLCGLASDRVLFSRVSPSPEVFHHPKSEVYPDQWFVAIPGSGQNAGCYAIKSKNTGKVLFSRMSPDPRVGHIDGDGKYPDNWFKFEAGSGKYAGYFRLRAVASDTVLVSRTSTGTDTQVINYPATSAKYDDQYFTILFDKDQLSTKGQSNLGGLQYARPRITTLDASRLPTPPGGWKFANLVNPSKPDSNLSHYPVLLFGSYTYTALSSAKDDNRMKIVAWDRNRNLVKELEKPGARYLWNITFNAGNQTVTFTGQSNQSIQATLDELVVRPAVVYLPSSSGPILPYTLTYAAADPSRFPVIKNGPYSFWPASFKDGRKSFCIAVADRDNLVQKLIECPGGKVIRDVQVNDAQRTIGLIGQDGSKATFNYDIALTCFYDFWLLVVGPGLIAGAAASGLDRPYIPRYKLSALERASLVGYSKFPCGPFDNTGRREDIFDSPFPRYQELPYSAAVVESGWSRIVDSTLISTKNPSISRNTFFVTSSRISTNTCDNRQSWPYPLQLPTHLILCPLTIRPFEILSCAPHQLDQHIPGKVFWTLCLFSFFMRSDRCYWCL